MCHLRIEAPPRLFLFILSPLYLIPYTSGSSPARPFPERERKKEYKTPKVSTVHLPPTTPLSHHDPNQEKRAFVKIDNGGKISKQLEEKICRKGSRKLCLYLANKYPEVRLLLHNHLVFRYFMSGTSTVRYEKYRKGGEWE